MLQVGERRAEQVQVGGFAEVTRTRGGLGDVGPGRGDPLATPV